MRNSRSLMLVTLASLLLPSVTLTQVKSYALDSNRGLRLMNVSAVPARLEGKSGLRITVSDSVARAGVAAGQAEPDLLAVIEGLEFSNGVIEAEIAGAPAPGTFEGARGFVGIAFRVKADSAKYDAFYLRPTNGRADDQERRNHATQYISHPAWTWSKLRRESPSKYESYVDLVPNAWTKIKIEVHGAQARLYVHDAPQPVLIVNDVKSGASAKGGVALWVGPGTIGHFRNLTVHPE